MDGQMNIFDFVRPTKRRPCEYSFYRYIGQRISTSHGEKMIASIHPYYTIFEDGMVGTPTDTIPCDPVERRIALEGELEYEEWRLAKEKDLCMRRIIENNIKCVSEAMFELSA